MQRPKRLEILHTCLPVRTRQATTGAGHKWRVCLRADLLLYALIEFPLATSARSSLPPQFPLALLRLTSVPLPNNAFRTSQQGLKYPRLQCLRISPSQNNFHYC